MTDKVDSLQDLEDILQKLELDLPAGVYFLGPLLGSLTRYDTHAGSPKAPPPNPARHLWFGADVNFSPCTVGIELFRPVEGRCGGWLYIVQLVVDALLTVNEVRTKIFAAAATLLAKRDDTCSLQAYEEELDRIELEGFPEEPLAN